MRQRICPVCGHFEDTYTEYCTECGAKTIEYEDDNPVMSRRGSEWEDLEPRKPKRDRKRERYGGYGDEYGPDQEAGYEADEEAAYESDEEEEYEADEPEEYGPGEPAGYESDEADGYDPEDEDEYDSEEEDEAYDIRRARRRPTGDRKADSRRERDREEKNPPYVLVGILALATIAILFLWNRNTRNGKDDSEPGMAAADGSVQSSEAEDVPSQGGDETGDGGAAGEEVPAEVEPGSVVEVGVNTYELIVADMTWTEAYYDCLDRGGHLVRITSDEEYQAILQQIEAEDKKNILFWLGGARNDDSGYYWIYEGGYFGSEVLNEDEKYASYWMENEPSFHDDAVGMDETRMNMFWRSSSGRWVWNDVPDDILSAAEFYAGKLGYICEYE